MGVSPSTVSRITGLDDESKLRDANGNRLFVTVKWQSFGTPEQLPVPYSASSNVRHLFDAAHYDCAALLCVQLVSSTGRKISTGRRTHFICDFPKISGSVEKLGLEKILFFG